MQEKSICNAHIFKRQRLETLNWVGLRMECVRERERRNARVNHIHAHLRNKHLWETSVKSTCTQTANQSHPFHNRTCTVTYAHLLQVLALLTAWKEGLNFSFVESRII